MDVLVPETRTRKEYIYATCFNRMTVFECKVGYRYGTLVKKASTHHGRLVNKVLQHVSKK